ncbi:hypothetical protein A6V36_23990 [Paraburkholderia ginsengiterrae]|uniref:Molecular chaperone Tir n=1 Tax=Paraburkholderia ginsengiterrae TaxID=1462993 RepID=A0A1A9N9Z2_9BURK|nr:hypothetical protein [Paraburkholderia ginsengiterrae]OAJ61443.1 hypothetical protein A6V36_23990 [Paraburkholderia ginsengiterrae]OAJ62846.1 hypothetical protein A6V37_21770 [Paraburkholderia ginsengiterrae]
MNTSEYRRVVEELCKVVGFNSPKTLFDGGRLRIDDYLVALIYDETFDPDLLQVYIDLGPIPADRAAACKTFLKINFNLSASQRGSLSVHPQTEHLFYSFRYRLDKNASGQALLDSLIRFVGDVGLEAMATV